jgi:hypothetical protein
MEETILDIKSISCASGFQQLRTMVERRILQHTFSSQQHTSTIKALKLS